MAKKNEKLPADSFVEEFKMLSDMLHSVYSEMKEFSKKKPDDALNNFKVTNINRVLVKVKVLLKDEPTIDFLDLLDDESLPTNSDAILIIGQYTASIKTYRAKFTNDWGRWKTKENPKGEN
ncbi:hypothetical protein [Labilibaculum euxinus]